MKTFNPKEINLLLKINSLVWDKMGRMLKNHNVDDCHLKNHESHPNTSYIAARDSAMAASVANKTSRVIDIEEDCSFSVDLNDPKLHDILKLI